MNSLVNYNKQVNLQVNNLMQIDEMLSTVFNDSAKILSDLLNDKDTTPSMKLRTIDTAIKLRKQIKEEEKFNLQMALKSADEESGIDWGDVEEDEQED